MRTRSLYFFTAFLELVGAAMLLRGQTTVDLTQHVGIDPYGSYSGGNVDHIDMMSGNLSAQIPLFSLPQKGKLTLGYQLVLNNNGWMPQTSCDDYGCINTWVHTTVAGPAIEPMEDPFVSTYALTWNLGEPPPNIQSTWQAYVGYNLIGASGATHAMLEDANNDTTLRTYDGSKYLYTPPFNRPFDLYADVTDQSWPHPVPANTPSLTYTLNGFGDIGGRAPGIVTTPDGISYCNPPNTPTNYTNQCGTSSTTEVISDTNGNQITITPYWFYGNLYTARQPSVITDSVGRTFDSPSISVSDTTGCPAITDPGNASPTSPDASSTWDVPGPNGTVKYLICYETIPINTNFDFSGVDGSEPAFPDGICPPGQSPDPNDQCVANFQYSGSVRVIQSVVLPNGTFWGFSYNPPPSDNSNDTGQYGDISQIILPTGGSIQYTYLGQNPSNLTGNRYILTRTLTPVAGTGESAATWTYSWNPAFFVSGNPVAMPGNSSITGPDGTVTSYGYSYGYPGAPSSETVTTIGPNGESETTTTNYNQVGFPNLQPSPPTWVANGSSPFAGFTVAQQSLPGTVTTTVSSNGASYTSTSTYSYDNPVPVGIPTCNLSSYNEGANPPWVYDACPSTVPGTTITSDDSPSSTIWVTSAPLGSRNWTTVTGTSGNTLQYTYDFYLWQHDNNYYQKNLMNLPMLHTSYDGSSVAAQTSYSYDNSDQSQGGVAGNLTEITRSNLQGLPSPVTDFYVNQQGYVYQIKDPNRNLTTVSGFDCSGGTASPPVALSASTYQQTTTAGGLTSDTWRDCNTGAVLESRDPNQQITVTTNDVAGNPVNISYPDGGSTTFDYGGYAIPFVISKQVSPLNKSYIYEDGFGRTIETLDPAGAEIDTTYDTMGRVHSVSNPHFGSPSSTDGTTIFSYDGLGRKRTQLDSDGTGTQTWTYTGPTVTYNDENSVASGNNHPWQRTYDEMGRLTAVVEPGSFNTTYEYDVLGNILCVDQWGTGTPGTACNSSVHRSFGYDMLSNLISASNPETGTVSYGYDANNNLTSKTDARGISVNYAYDALDRLTWKHYLQGASQIASPVGFGYDGKDENGNSMNPIPANSKGRLSHSSNEVNAAENYSYDAMGRLTQETYCTPSNCSYTNMVQAGYDPAGNLTSLTYPDGRVVTNSFDGGGQLQQVQLQSWNGTSVNYPYLNYLQYWPNGSLMSATFGSGAEEDVSLNNRLQPTSFSLKGSQAGFQGQSFMSKQPSYGPGCGSGNGNNGNIYQITDALNSNKTQSFCYDGLNRLTSFAMADGSMSQTYSIDAFGNADQTAPGTLQNNLSFNMNNQINSSGYGYDAAGNLTTIPSPLGGTETVNFDAEGRITNLNNDVATYTYDANGDRVRKDLGTGDWTEYLYFGGQPITELNNDGSWSDYIFANGKRIARSDSFDERIHIEGTSNTAGSYAAWYLPFSGYVIQAGDKISWRQYQDSSVGGIGISFTDGTNTNWSVVDTDGQTMNSDNTQGAWHLRTVDLTPFAGKTANNLWVTADAGTPVGPWLSYFADISIYSTNGNVTPIYYRQTSTGLSYFGGGDESNTQAFAERGNTPADAESPWNTTTFYSADQIGSARMLSSGGGWPVSADTYYPFGQEIYAPADSNHYKFTGKERDTESSNDYFGARYYGSSMGRFLSPDPLGNFVADVSNPQTWNMYAYAMNNPLRFIDPTGYDCAYLNNAGTSIESLDQESTQGECNKNGGYWADGAITNFQASDNGSYTFTSLDSNLNTLYTGYSGSNNIDSTVNLDVMSYFADYQIQQRQLQGETLLNLPQGQRIQLLAAGVTKDAQCAIHSVTKNLPNVGVDAAGIAIPGEGAVGLVSGVAIHSVSTTLSAAQKDSAGAWLSVGEVIKDPAIEASKEAYKGVPKAVPVLGQVYSGFLTARDVWNMSGEYSECF